MCSLIPLRSRRNALEDTRSAGDPPKSATIWRFPGKLQSTAKGQQTAFPGVGFPPIFFRWDTPSHPGETKSSGADSGIRPCRTRPVVELPGLLDFRQRGGRIPAARTPDPPPPIRILRIGPSPPSRPLASPTTPDLPLYLHCVNKIRSARPIARLFSPPRIGDPSQSVRFSRSNSLTEYAPDRSSLG